MYDLQEYYRYIDELNNYKECNGCTFLFDHVKCKLVTLTKADIKRLERESNDD